MSIHSEEMKVKIKFLQIKRKIFLMMRFQDIEVSLGA
jgi:hypothetical protein